MLFCCMTDITVNAQSKRVHLVLTNTVIDTSSGCNPSNGIPSAIETVVLIKKGTCKLNHQIPKQYMEMNKSWKTKLTWVCNFLLPCFLVEFFSFIRFHSVC